MLECWGIWDVWDIFEINNLFLLTEREVCTPYTPWRIFFPRCSYRPRHFANPNSGTPPRIHFHSLDSTFFELETSLQSGHSEHRIESTTRILFANYHEKQGTCQVDQEISLQYFYFLFSISARYHENIFKSDLVLYTVFLFFLFSPFFLLPSIKSWILSLLLLLSLVRFLLPFGPVRTDILVCAFILVRKNLAILVEEAEWPVRFVSRRLWAVKVLFTLSQGRKI